MCWLGASLGDEVHSRGHPHDRAELSSRSPWLGRPPARNPSDTRLGAVACSNNQILGSPGISLRLMYADSKVTTSKPIFLLLLFSPHSLFVSGVISFYDLSVGRNQTLRVGNSVPLAVSESPRQNAKKHDRSITGKAKIPIITASGKSRSKSAGSWDHGSWSGPEIRPGSSPPNQSRVSIIVPGSKVNQIKQSQ